MEPEPSDRSWFSSYCQSRGEGLCLGRWLGRGRFLPWRPGPALRGDRPVPLTRPPCGQEGCFAITAAVVAAGGTRPVDVSSPTTSLEVPPQRLPGTWEPKPSLPAQGSAAPAGLGSINCPAREVLVQEMVPGRGGRCWAWLAGAQGTWHHTAELPGSEEAAVARAGVCATDPGQSCPSSVLP